MASMINRALKFKFMLKIFFERNSFEKVIVTMKVVDYKMIMTFLKIVYQENIRFLMIRNTILRHSDELLVKLFFKAF